MRHFEHIGAAERQRLFHVEPQPFTSDAPAEILAVGLGATLYSPATRRHLADDIEGCSTRGVTSMVVCLEDAVADGDLADAEVNAVAHLRALAERPTELPLLFVRVRRPEQIRDLTNRLGGAARLLSGFVLPKFTAEGGASFLDEVTDASAVAGHRMFAMPVIETASAVHRESRAETLADVALLLSKHREDVLAVRIGATDLCGAYGLRRPPDLTIYDLHVVADAIADVVNVLGRPDGTGFVVTGPVWEYFTARERMFKPQLRSSPFSANEADDLRERLIAKALDGLIREVHLDQANGLTGKTVIHPTHVPAVHALSVVTHEEFSDANDVLGVRPGDGGAFASGYANKMNEAKPHRVWAERIMRRAEIFGVAAEDVSFVDLLDVASG